MERRLFTSPLGSIMQEQFPRTARTQRPRRISVFDGQDLKKALLAGAAWLEEHREAINALNVFPVPDGDTGSNMSATMQAAMQGIVDSNETSAGAVADRKSTRLNSSHITTS